MSKKKIKKLKIIEVRNNGLIIESIDGNSGFIHISEVAPYYVENLNKYFKAQDYVYGVQIRKNYNTRYYSLKQGHSFDKNEKIAIKETGGGFNVLTYHLEKMKSEE